MRVALFSVGQTTSGGRSLTRDDLLRCADAYDPSVARASLAIGAPRGDTEPAFGWVTNLSVVGLELVASLHLAGGEDVAAATAGILRLGPRVRVEFYEPASPHNPRAGSWYCRLLRLPDVDPPGGRHFLERFSAQADFADPSMGVLCFANSQAGSAAVPLSKYVAAIGALQAFELESGRHCTTAEAARRIGQTLTVQQRAN